MNRVSFKTLGCRLNQAETARIKAIFKDSLYEIVPFGDQSDVCVIHTCTVTAAAEKECIRLARSVIRRFPETLVILAGCAAEIAGEQLRKTSGAHRIVGHADKYRIPELIRDRVGQPAGQAGSVTSQDSLSDPAGTVEAQDRRSSSGRSIVPLFDTTRAWVKAQDGCSFHCAYCIVPMSRGPSTSRPRREILYEIEALAGAGYREVVITGANLGCYTDGTAGLIDLLSEVEKIPELLRIRLSSIEVSTTERDVIAYMADSEKLADFIHLPLQTGDDRLLAAMGRRYTSLEYRRLIDFIMEKIPQAGIGSDIITGLPGEDEEAFRNTMKMVNDIPYGNLHVFPYSPRRGTRAASMPGQIPRETARARAATLIAIGKEKKERFASRFVGKEVEVLVENVDADGTASGWTREYVRAAITQPDLKPNDIVRLTPSHTHNGILS